METTPYLVSMRGMTCTCRQMKHACMCTYSHRNDIATTSQPRHTYTRHPCKIIHAMLLTILIYSRRVCSPGYICACCCLASVCVRVDSLACTKSCKHALNRVGSHPMCMMMTHEHTHGCHASSNKQHERIHMRSVPMSIQLHMHMPLHALCHIPLIEWPHPAKNSSLASSSCYTSMRHDM